MPVPISSATISEMVGRLSPVRFARSVRDCRGFARSSPSTRAALISRINALLPARIGCIATLTKVT